MTNFTKRVTYYSPQFSAPTKTGTCTVAVMAAACQGSSRECSCMTSFTRAWVSWAKDFIPQIHDFIYTCMGVLSKGFYPTDSWLHLHVHGCLARGILSHNLFRIFRLGLHHFLIWFIRQLSVSRGSFVCYRYNWHFGPKVCNNCPNSPHV